MSQTGETWLAVIAVAVVIMAAVQIGVIIAGLRLVRRVEKIAADFENSIKPLIAHLTALSSEASRAATLAAGQIDRFDRVFADLTARVDRTLAAAQDLLVRPARDGMAIIAGIRAAFSALQGGGDRPRRRSGGRAPGFEEEEDSLFIG